MSKIEDVKKVGKHSYLINDSLILEIKPDGSINVKFDDIDESEIDEFIDEFFRKPVEHKL